jgi:PAS domain S-box-containing protein
MKSDTERDALRRRAEAKLTKVAPAGEADAMKLLHELQVHQVELEMQNAELRQSQADLAAANERYVDFYDLSRVAFISLERDGSIREANLTACRFLGAECVNLIGRRLGAYIHESQRAHFKTCLSKALAGARGERCAAELMTPDGGSRHLWMELTAANVEGVCRMVALDVGEQKRSELALERERGFLRQVIDASPSMIFVKHRDGRFLLVNTALAHCYGGEVADIVDHSDADFNADAEAVTHYQRDDQEVMDSRISKRITEEKVGCADGTTHFFTTHKVPLIDADGACDRVLGVATDITALKQAQMALQEADRLKNEFLAMLGHELRNPLVPIRNAAYVSGRLESTDKTLKWAHELIERQVQHLSRMVDDLLDLTRILSTKIQLKRDRLDLANIVAHALETARLLAEERHQSLEVTLPQRTMWIEGDAARLTQVLVNLLRNAVKYTDPGGRIELTARVSNSAEPAGVELTVRDNGMGIAPDLLPRIFDLFSQDQRALDRAQGGLGIGLALVRGITELHGGRVTASSDGPGLGSCFTLWLPLQKAPATSAAAARAQRPPVTPVRVLLVDDDPLVLESTAFVLKLDGHEVATAASGAEALSRLAVFQPQVVLLDIGLPGMNGYETARRIRALPQGKKLELVALSGYGQEDDIQRSLAAGFNQHLVKPAALEVLAGVLERVAQAKPQED